MQKLKSGDHLNVCNLLHAGVKRLHNMIKNYYFAIQNSCIID